MIYWHQCMNLRRILRTLKLLPLPLKGLSYLLCIQIISRLSKNNFICQQTKTMFIDDLDMKYHFPYKYTALNTSCREMIALMSFSRVYTHNARPGKNSSWPALTGTLHKLRRKFMFFSFHFSLLVLADEVTKILRNMFVYIF